VSRHERNKDVFEEAVNLSDADGKDVPISRTEMPLLRML